MPQSSVIEFDKRFLNSRFSCMVNLLTADFVGVSCIEYVSRILELMECSKDWTVSKRHASESIFSD